MQQGSFRKALLLDGETRSRVYSPKDRQTAFLFGDGGVAALIERREELGESNFSLHSDGSRESLIKIDAGGYRNPSSAETVREKIVDEHGNIRSDEQAYMKGADVFNFVLREIPKTVKNVLAYAGLERDTIDYFVFHQANTYMNGYLAKKMKVDSDKVPMCLDKFGNTSSVSIPLTIVSELQGKLPDARQVLLCGFGVGLSWAAAILSLEHCYLSELIELE
jgi:3-oxoacyl-[acyl-carrier-protein] synthase-3